MVPMGTNIWAKGSRQHDDDVGERLQPPLWAKGCMQHNDDGDDKQSIYHDDDDERPRQHDDDDDGAIEFVFLTPQRRTTKPNGALSTTPRGAYNPLIGSPKRGTPSVLAPLENDVVTPKAS